MSLEGIWKSRGYGWILKIDPSGYALFDHTANAAIEFERGSTNDFERGFELFAREDTSHLNLCVRNDLTRYDFDKIVDLPTDALLMSAPRRTNPRENLDFFCNVFAQDYAFFDLRGVVWEEICAVARSNIEEHATSAQLFSELHRLITPLGDNHVMLTDGMKLVNSEKIAGIKALLRKELGLTTNSIGDPESIARISPYINEEFLGGSARVAGNGSAIWGMIEPGVGYLNILKLFGLSDSTQARTATDLPPRRADHARFLQDDLHAVSEIMERVLADLGSARALIVDARINGGGFDTAGMAIANCFADKKRLAFTKHARDGTGVTPRQEFFIQPSGDFQFTRPVYLLTSARTASAGEIFVLCMRCLPHVTVVGQRSVGILSDNLRKHLPNGWITSISNEFYCSANGSLFEGAGVPVDVETPVFVEQNFRAGYRAAFETALELSRT